MIPPSVAVFLLGQASPAQALLDDLRLSLGGGSEDRVAARFARRADADYLFRMARNRGGLRKVKVAVVPAPPGWGDSAYWAVFHTTQEIEEDHDPVYQTVRTPDGLMLGHEVPEKLEGFNRVTHAEVTANLDAARSYVFVTSSLTLTGSTARKATVLRLNDDYDVADAGIDDQPASVVEASDQSVPTVHEGDVLRAGGLLVCWTPKAPRRLAFTYGGTVDTPYDDKIRDDRCYLTAWWVPSTARLPFTTKVTIHPPQGWVVRSEGILASQDDQGVTYRCDVPITYPKIIGGRYQLAATLTDRGRLFRAYQLAPIDAARGQKTVELASKAVAWLEDRLVPFPFPGYDTFEATGYYGIESYSHTLLEKTIMNRFVSHEIGHTYFGGLAPCPYVEDSWNESVTQYVDSVLYHNDEDRTLEDGLRSLKFKAPLTVMAAPHDWGGYSYTRGAFVMRMLEHEIGLPAVFQGLKALVTERRGQSTTWRDLQGIFEKASGKNLGWFWDQWVTADTFPSLRVVSWNVEEWNGQKQAKVIVRQTGTATPYRLRFLVRLSNGPHEANKEVTMSSPEAVFTVPVDFGPAKADLDVLGYALVTVDGIP